VEVPSGGAVMNVDFSADKVVANIGEVITFTDLTDNSPTHWSWRFDNAGVSIAQNPTFSFLTTGFKNITLLAGKVGAGGVEIKNSYIEILAALILDAFPNAAVAYSIRKLRTLYTGSAIRVRRSSDNAEQDIGFNGSNGLDTTALLAFVGAGNGFVTTWYDQSGNGKDATQSTSANQPQIVSSGSLILDNGKTSLQFDGNRGLRNTNLVYTTNTLFATSVFSKDNNASFTVLLSQNSDGVGRSSVLSFNNTSPAKSNYFFNNGTSYNNESLNTFPNSTQTLMTNYSFGNDYFNAINGGGGNNVISGQSFTPVSVNGTGIGQSPNQTQRHLGKIQEIILWNSDQSANKTAIETNINTYYNVF
jgi:PKD repeat protein